MVIMNIDRLAYTSRLKNIDPVQKLIFALITLCICLWANEIIISIIVVLIMTFITVVNGKIPLKVFLGLMFLPVSFLVIGVVTIAINISTKSVGFLWYFYLDGNYIGVSVLGLETALKLFFKALGSVSCMYFLSLNTPMVSLMSSFKRLKIPKLIIELMELIYRFIFVLIETADTIYTAQNARLGYSRISLAYRSISVLIASVFIRAYKRSDEVYISLESRGYDGELNVLEEPFEKDMIKFALGLMIDVGLVGTALFLKNQTLGGIF
jgi:cobalt/nickel transport system permease protein